MEDLSDDWCSVGGCSGLRRGLPAVCPDVIRAKMVGITLIRKS